ncbi:MAG: threonine-phosphate decarboxylase CobD [Deltaproteobacteria bacterium]|nr:threonine-phosphate decarboxylase CobD [Deltaproteobacteria bacterium]
MEFDHGGYIKGYENVIDFSSNVNPLPIPKRVERLLKKSIERMRYYPDPFCEELKEAVCRELNLPADMVLFGNGSTEIIYLITRVFKPKKVLIFEPTFSEYKKASLLEGASVSKLYLNSRFELETTSHEEVDMLFLCHPNNPTGNFVIERNEMIFDFKAGYYVVDEAFIDFVDEKEKYSFLSFLNGRERLIILRTFTKFFPLAGLRIGYVLSKSDTIERLKRFQPPWTVNAFAMIALKAFLLEREFQEKTLKVLKSERLYLARKLKELGFEVYPSLTNFLLIRLKDGQSSTLVKEELLKKGILVRDCSNFEGLGDRFIRVCVKTRSENRKLIQALSSL